MAFLPAISSGLATLKTGSELISRLREALSPDIRLDEIMARIIEVQAHIADGRTAFIEAQEAFISKSEEIQNLQNRIQVLESNQTVFLEEGACWQEQHGQVVGPFCPSCWGLSQRRVLMQVAATFGDNTWRYHCVHHNAPVYSSLTSEIRLKYNVQNSR